jgi:hypothetical protein
MLPPPAERPKLRAALDQLSGAVEELLLGGLTTASDATRKKIAGAMEEAARMRLLRLGAILRVLADDLERFTKHDPLLSRRRLTLFLNRGWLVARGLSHALATGDEKEFDRLNLTPTTQPLPSVDVVCLGVVKKQTASLVQFQFRFRALSASGPVKAGDAVSWSFNHAVKVKDLPAESYLHMSQKQKFTPSILLERKVIAVRNAVAVADGAGWRLALGEQSTVTAGQPFTAWDQYLDWTPAAARDRLAAVTPGPLDLESELQEEVVFREYFLGEPADGDEPGQAVYPVTAGRFELRAVVGAANEGKALRKRLDDLRAAKTRPPLFGLMHYERCRLVLQPLTSFGGNVPEYLTISTEKVDRAALLRELF